jgi:hypothetical protein
VLDPKVFKAYDVRGIYPSELDEEGAPAIGRAYVEERPRRDRLDRHLGASSVPALDSRPSALLPHAHRVNRLVERN